MYRQILVGSVRASSSPPPDRRRAFLAAAVLLALVLGGGCRVETDVGIRVAEDGSGAIAVAVVLDAEAVKRAGNVREEIRTADLEAAGWSVDGPTALDGGGQRVEITRRFATPEEGEEVFRSLATEVGPFGDVRITQQRGLWSTTTAFDASVDLTGGLAAFGDPALTEALQGQPLGVPPEALEQRLGGALDQVFTLTIATRLPGEMASNAPTQIDGGARWAPTLGERVTLTASSTSWNRLRIALSVVAAVCALGAIGLSARWAGTRRRTESAGGG